MGLTIGNETHSNKLRGFDDSLDDMRIYNSVLSADEVERLYQLGR